MAQNAVHNVSSSRKAVKTLFWQTDKPATKAHILLIVLNAAPLIGIIVPTSVNIVLQAALAVFCGAWRSVKAPGEAQSETMTKKDAFRFPLVGSAVLLGLFLLFKFVPVWLVNALLSLYLGLVAIFVLTSAVHPFVINFFPDNIKHATITIFKFKIPYLIDNSDQNLQPTVPEIIIAAISSTFCLWYYIKKHWFANNSLGLAFCLEGIEHLNVGSVHTATILLLGLFFYDIFWVFCTPVMVSVAKNFDAPIKLLFPRGGLIDGKRAFSMLGLGDIVIPGIVVALFLRYDVLHNFRTKYFQSAFGGYILGLSTTIFVMNYFQAAQPALLYIVPCVLGCVFLHAAANGEFKKIFDHAEEEEEGGGKGDKVGGDTAKAGGDIKQE